MISKIRELCEIGRSKSILESWNFIECL